MFSKSARNANTSSIGLLIITVFSKVATSRSFLTPWSYPLHRPLRHPATRHSLGPLLPSFVGKRRSWAHRNLNYPRGVLAGALPRFTVPLSSADVPASSCPQGLGIVRACLVGDGRVSGSGWM